MNCVELQESLAEVETGRTPEQRSHLDRCPSCAGLLQELDYIIAAAAELRAADEPSPRVWNSLEIELRREGLIRPQAALGRKTAAESNFRWGWAAWLVPSAAMLLLALGIYQHNQGQKLQVGTMVPPVSGITSANAGGLNDDDLLREVADNSPALRSEYEVNLRRVNDSIRDSQGVVDENPNDEDARRALMDAYQQKSMLFEMAMDRQ